MNKPRTFDDALRAVADDINQQSRQTVLELLYRNNDFKKFIHDEKRAETYVKGNKTKTMRKIASIPLEVDKFFTDVYGEDYYKDPDFFKKVAPEWTVVDDI